MIILILRQRIHSPLRLPASLEIIFPSQIRVIRGIHSSQYSLAKKNSKSKNESGIKQLADSDTFLSNEVPAIDMTVAKQKFEDALDRFSRSASDARMGKTSALIFDRLLVRINNEDVPFTTVAQASIKGRIFVITLFDPQNAHTVINAILGSGLNMNAQIDPTNSFSLRCPLPPVTAESKRASVKQLKEAFELARNGSNRNSLACIRMDIKKKFKRMVGTKLSDDQNRIIEAFEALHKEYCDKLTEICKQLEQAIFK